MLLYIVNTSRILVPAYSSGAFVLVTERKMPEVMKAQVYQLKRKSDEL